MTHSLHRQGEVAKDKDYVWLMYQSKGINDQDIAEKAKKFIASVEVAGSINWGDVKSGPIVKIPEEEVKANIGNKSRLRGVFTSKEQIGTFLKEIKAADVGLSVIVAGLLDLIQDACREAEVKPHTINYSVGVFGNKDKLPEEEVLSITTMCGHHMVPDGLVRKMINDVKKGKKDADEAGWELATYCPCGIFNQERAAEILRVEKEASEKEESKV